MHLRYIEYVICAAEQKSFSKAAELLYVSQPALSQAIMRLEANLGARLFNRDKNTNTVSLTPAGELFVQEGRYILEHYEQLRRNICSETRLFVGDLKIGAAPFTEKYYLGKILPVYQKIFPGVHIRVVEGFKDELIRMVTRGKLDVCITSAPEASDPDCPLACEKILAERIFLVVNDRNPLLHRHNLPPGNGRAAVDLSLFRGENFILYPKGRALRKTADELCKNAGFSPNVALETNGCEMVNTLVQENMGVGFVPEPVALTNARNPSLHYYLIDGNNTGRIKSILWHKQNNSFAVKEFIRATHTYFDSKDSY